METELGNRRLSTAFQFESRLGIGVRLGQGSELGASTMHYSNAHLGRPNEGFEVYSMVYRQAL